MSLSNAEGQMLLCGFVYAVESTTECSGAACNYVPQTPNSRPHAALFPGLCLAVHLHLSQLDSTTVCLPGYGKRTLAPNAKCEICPKGQWQDGTSPVCFACSNSTFYSPVDGLGPAWTTAGTTPFEGAIRLEDCVPIQSQLTPEAGQAFFPIISDGSAGSAALQGLVSAATTQGSDLATCLGACPTDMCCFTQYDMPNGVCRTAVLEADATNATTGLQLHYKLPPVGPGAAALSIDNSKKRVDQVQAKGLASGWFGTCSVPAAQAAAWQAIGSALTPDARAFVKNNGTALWHTGTTRAACKALCEDSNVCLGFIFDAANGACLFRGGIDALASRAFFSVPTTAAWTA